MSKRMLRLCRQVLQGVSGYLFAQVMPPAAIAVLMAPMAIVTASNMGLSPYALTMVVALGSSASFLSPVGHPVNLLVMGIGGYRFTDYTVWDCLWSFCLV
jgi:di/tricarboxylate transporter